MMNFIISMWWLWLMGVVLAIGWELVTIWRFAVTDDKETTWFGFMALGHFLVIAFGTMLAVSIIGNIIVWVEGF